MYPRADILLKLISFTVSYWTFLSEAGIFFPLLLVPGSEKNTIITHPVWYYHLNSWSSTSSFTQSFCTISANVQHNCCSITDVIQKSYSVLWLFQHHLCLLASIHIKEDTVSLVLKPDEYKQNSTSSHIFWFIHL